MPPLLVRLVFLFDSILVVVAPPPPALAAPPVVHRQMPVIAQEANLACEAASLQMALAAAGIDATQDAILEAIGADLRPPVRAGGRVVRWGNPNRAFVGDVHGHEFDATGYGVYAGPVAQAAAALGARVLASGRVEAGRLYELAAAGHPAVVWVPFDGDRYRQSGPLLAYTAWDGETVVWGPGFEHAVALAGITADGVLLHNPRWGFRSELDRAGFEAIYAVFGEMAVVLD